MKKIHGSKCFEKKMFRVLRQKCSVNLFFYSIHLVFGVGATEFMCPFSLSFSHSSLPCIAAEIVAGVPCEIEVFTGSQPLGITLMAGVGSFQVRKKRNRNVFEERNKHCG